MEIIYFHKKPTGGRFYLSLVRTLLLATFVFCCYGRTRKDLLIRSISQLKRVFRYLFNGRSCTTVSSLLSQISDYFVSINAFLFNC